VKLEPIMPRRSVYSENQLQAESRNGQVKLETVMPKCSVIYSWANNTPIEFLIFQLESKEEGIEVLYQDETLWLTQDAIATLFDKGRSTIAEHFPKPRIARRFSLSEIPTNCC
jgi:hypothetical protein